MVLVEFKLQDSASPIRFSPLTTQTVRVRDRARCAARPPRALRPRHPSRRAQTKHPTAGSNQKRPGARQHTETHIFRFAGCPAGRFKVSNSPARLVRRARTLARLRLSHPTYARPAVQTQPPLRRYPSTEARLQRSCNRAPRMSS